MSWHRAPLLPNTERRPCQWLSNVTQTVRGRKVTHCRVTVWAPGIGRSISRSRRLRTMNTQLHRSVGSSSHLAHPGRSCHWPFWQNSCVPAHMALGTSQPLGVHINGARDSGTHTFPVEPTSLSPSPSPLGNLFEISDLTLSLPHFKPSLGFPLGCVTASVGPASPMAHPTDFHPAFRLLAATTRHLLPAYDLEPDRLNSNHTPPLPHCVTSGRMLNLSVPMLPQQEMMMVTASQDF